MIDKNNRELYWIAIDIANQAGFDKMSFDNRIAWVESNIDNLEGLAEEADSVLEYSNAVHEFRQVLAGNKSNHMVYLDASNQALQLYAVLTGDKQTGSTCNLANGDFMADAYQMLADGMNEILHTNLTRKDCKKALMTTMYGKSKAWKVIVAEVMGEDASIFDFVKQVNDNRTTQPYLHYWYDKENEIDIVRYAFESTLLKIAPKAVTTMDILTQINSDLVKDVYRWTMPDGFKVKFDVKAEINYPLVDEVDANHHKLINELNNDLSLLPKYIKLSKQEFSELTTERAEQLKTQAIQHIYTIDYKTVITKGGFPIHIKISGLEKYEADAESRAMSPNIIHSVDGYIAREMIRRMNGKFITTIHDAFACHPSDCDLMIQNYKDILIDILDSTLLNDITEEVSGFPVEIKKAGTLTADDIQNSVYLLG